MSKPVVNLRLFVGIYPPPEAAERLLASLDVLDLPQHHRLMTRQVHLTLQFIGDVPAKQLDSTIESVERVAKGLRTFVLHPEKLITLPKRGAARLVAVQTDAPTPLPELHRRLVSRLARTTRSNPDDRFLPHLTLCRFRKPARGLQLKQAFEMDAFPVDRLCLMRSVLKPEGAEHVMLESFVLCS